MQELGNFHVKYNNNRTILFSTATRKKVATAEVYRVNPLTVPRVKSPSPETLYKGV